MPGDDLRQVHKVFGSEALQDVPLCFKHDSALTLLPGSVGHWFNQSHSWDTLDGQHLTSCHSADMSVSQGPSRICPAC